jgi:CspA family cold shock protein
LDEAAGLGIIVAADGTEYPFHCVEIADGTRTIETGAAVDFDVLHKLGGVEARRIRPSSPM